MLREEDAEKIEALQSIARALRDLGNGNAATHMGAIEALGLILKVGLTDVAEAIHDLAQAIREHG